MGIDGFDLLLGIGLFAGAGAHLGGHPGNCSNIVVTQIDFVKVSKVPLKVCPHCPHDKNTQICFKIPHNHSVPRFDHF